VSQMLDIVRESIVFARVEEISQCLALIRQVRVQGVRVG
jgi:hypothetical protein